jgi:hypothetical protein
MRYGSSDIHEDEIEAFSRHVSRPAKLRVEIQFTKRQPVWDTVCMTAQCCNFALVLVLLCQICLPVAEDGKNTNGSNRDAEPSNKRDIQERHGCLRPGNGTEDSLERHKQSHRFLTLMEFWIYIIRKYALELALPGNRSSQAHDVTLRKTCSRMPGKLSTTRGQPPDLALQHGEVALVLMASCKGHTV